ncbi:MAG: hypothetical protein L3J99_07140 [Thermoplasmata archaeon]|nr:hypothetical protein [Thermoplasmata archaeon]
MTPNPSQEPAPDTLRTAEAALARLGFSRIPPVVRVAAPTPEFWVQEAGVPRRAFPVFVEGVADLAGTPRPARWVSGTEGSSAVSARAIVVVPSETAARAAWASGRGLPNGPIESELAILVVPSSRGAEAAHWHRGLLAPRTLLRLATGVAVGLFRQAQSEDGTAQVDFSEMLEILKNRFQVDVAGSLGVRTDEESLYVLYQLAIRDSYAPGDSGSELFAIVLRPFGPGPRVPWFAA